MAYNEFAYFYDEFNGEADYDALYAHIHAKLKEHGIHDGILADLGCGTGELTLMLTQAGYDMIGIDQSEEMLCVVRDKAEQLGLSGRLLLLRQDLLKLDLYGTIRGAVSTFDTFNHIPDLDTVPVVCVAVLGGWFILRPDKAQNANTDINYVQVSPSKRDVSNTLSGTGTLNPANTYNVKSLVAGKVLTSSFEEGDIVEEGTVLYTVDSSDCLLYTSDAADEL